MPGERREGTIDTSLHGLRLSNDGLGWPRAQGAGPPRKNGARVGVTTTNMFSPHGRILASLQRRAPHALLQRGRLHRLREAGERASERSDPKLLALDRCRRRVLAPGALLLIDWYVVAASICRRARRFMSFVLSVA